MHTGIRDLELLRVAVDGADGFLNRLPAGLQPIQRALDLLRQTLHLLHVGEEHLHLGALLGIRPFARRDHGACRCELAGALARGDRIVAQVVISEGC